MKTETLGATSSLRSSLRRLFARYLYRREAARLYVAPRRGDMVRVLKTDTTAYGTVLNVRRYGDGSVEAYVHSTNFQGWVFTGDLLPYEVLPL